jgi:hypothetical protein
MNKSQQFENGKTLKERVINALGKVPEKEWDSLYKFLEEWQLMGIALMVLEQAEES